MGVIARFTMGLVKGTIVWMFWLACIGLLGVSCNFSKEKNKIGNGETSLTALKVVENAISTAGTYKKWNNIASLSYTKKSRLLLENGEIESELTQRHQYVFRPNKSIKIRWEVAHDSFLIVHNDSVSLKFKNDSLIEQGNRVKSTVNSALYVLGMPFKLLDNGTVLNYEGLRWFNGVDSVHSIKATYAPEEHPNHSTSDVWWFHFDKDNFSFPSSLVYHEPTYALIENEIVVEAEGLIFPGIRKSYRCDALGKKQFLRAEFWYEDYDITFLEE